MSDEITQQTLLPEVRDPNLWMVKCRIGEEKVTVLQLMRKMIAYQYEEEPLLIRLFFNNFRQKSFRKIKIFNFKNFPENIFSIFPIISQAMSISFNFQIIPGLTPLFV